MRDRERLQKMTAYTEQSVGELAAQTSGIQQAVSEMQVRRAAAFTTASITSTTSTASTSSTSATSPPPPLLRPSPLYRQRSTL